MEGWPRLPPSAEAGPAGQSADVGRLTVFCREMRRLCFERTEAICWAVWVSAVTPTPPGLRPPGLRRDGIRFRRGAVDGAVRDFTNRSLPSRNNQVKKLLKQRTIILLFDRFSHKRSINNWLRLIQGLNAGARSGQIVLRTHPGRWLGRHRVWPARA